MKNISNSIIRFAIGMAVTILFSFLLFKSPMILTQIEAKFYDYRFILRGTVHPPDSVVIAAIDEKSLARFGRWPWGRDVMAQLVEKLSQSDAAVIGFDIIFPESDKHDPRLAKAMRDAGNVILPMALDFEKQAKPISDSVLENSAIVSFENVEMFNTFPPIMSGGVLTIPVPMLKKSAKSLAHISMFPDEFDGTLRWEHLLLGYDNFLYPTLGLRCASTFLGVPDDKLTVQASRGIKVGKTFIPTDHWSRMPINYYGPGKTFKYISIADIIDGAVGREVIDNRIVLIGATAIGLYDLRVTPFSAVTPGVEKHAAVAASIIQNNFIKKATPFQEGAFQFIVGVLLSLALSRMRLLWGAVTALTAAIFVALVGFVLFAEHGIWMNMASPINMVLLMFIIMTAWNYAFEERHSRKIRSIFSNYVTHALVNELINNPEMAKLGGEKREVTVLFSDVKGFTTFSERNTPEDVVALLNEYLCAMTKVVLKWEGTLDKFIGDAIVVFWNAPIRRENHAELALLCATEMLMALEQLHEKWENEGKPKLSCGIGINTGEVVVGNIGAEGLKMDYTVIGDHVNLGARVEGLTRIFKADILATETTVEHIRNAVEAGTLKGLKIEGERRVIVKGKELPVTVYAVTRAAIDQPATIIECEDQEPLKLTEK